VTRESDVTEEWLIEKLVPGGAGFARREDGTAAFVDGALPGERVLVSRVEQKKGYARALGFRVLNASSERVEPPCAIARECGGCDWLHLDYEAQLAHKAALVGEALRRTGGFLEFADLRVAPSPRTQNYRVRIRLHIDERGQVGFYAAQSHRLIAVEYCLAARPELNLALAAFRAAARAFPQELAQFAEVELRVSPSAPEWLLAFVPRGRSRPKPKFSGPLFSELEKRFAIAVADQAPSEVQRFPLGPGRELEVFPGAFVQVNWEVNLLLVEQIVEGARERGASSFLDIYAGAGNFTLPLADLGLRGVSVEAHPLAAAGCERSLARYGFERVTVLSENVESALAKLTRAESRFDFAVLDPPRSGAREILPALRRLNPKHIAYLSCDPVTLARDLRALVELGYDPTSIMAFDMFPGTHHVETLAWLRLRDA
jgi:23S rRNA (uracil1939-C5)-methyltransferase